ncbi:lipase family protein [Nocardia donostiensis]|uniref:lipase family protein n=1 Tax=Nocardia donostiensis TaxID=1538463 RepID=UPI0011159B90
MRYIRAVVTALVAICVLPVAAATAQPPTREPVPPAAAPGELIPGLQEWIERVLPPPMIPQTPRDRVSQPGDMSPALAALHHAVLPSAVGDPLFDHWPADLADRLPGEVIEVRDITATAAPLLVVPVRRALLLKYRTSDAHGRPSFATATLAVPAAAWQGQGSRPVVVNNLPIDALGRDCTPGYSLAHGFSSHTSLTDFVPPTSQLALLRNYAVLVPDHEGPWMSYAEPYVGGYAVLDAIRAVRAHAPAEFAASRFGLVGYSGGAIATNGAVKLLGSYAPELVPVVAGAALGGVPADFELLTRSMNGNLASGVFMAAVLGIGRERPQILTHMNKLAQWVAISPMKDQCIGTFALPGVLHLPIEIAADVPDPLRSPVATEIYRVTAMADMRSATPLYIYHGDHEFWLPAEGARALFAEQCALGVPAVYRAVPGEHIIAGALGYPEAMIWLDDRLRGLPAPDECG